MNERIYILLSSADVPLAKGKLLSSPGAETLLIQVLEDKEETVAEHEVLQLIPMTPGEPSLQCQILQQRAERFELKRMSVLTPELRRSLRMPVRFETYVYPLSGSWEGRCAARSIDLSCGGIAFYANQTLEVGEQAEIVIPITSSPLILRIQILRRQELRNGRIYYASKFVDLCADEDQMVCEAVFSVQLHSRPRGAETEERKD